jgi:hypothetical protein
MANSFTTQILQEGPRNAIIKLAGVLDTSDQALTTAVDVTTLTQGGVSIAPAQVRIDHIDYSISDQLEVQLWWDATTDVIIMPIAGRGKMSFWNFGGLNNNSGAGKSGNILIKTTGYASGTQVFSVILELVKQGPDQP